MHLVEIQHFVNAMLQAAQCSGYRAQLPTIAPGFDSHWGCDYVEWKNSEYSASSIIRTSFIRHSIIRPLGQIIIYDITNTFPVNVGQ